MMRRLSRQMREGRLPLRPILIAKLRSSIKSAALAMDLVNVAFSTLCHPAPSLRSACQIRRLPAIAGDFKLRHYPLAPLIDRGGCVPYTFYWGSCAGARRIAAGLFL